MQNGIRNVVSRMNGIEKPSTPSLKRIVSASQRMALDELEARRAGVEAAPGHERQQEGQRPWWRAPPSARWLFAASLSPRSVRMKAAPTSGRIRRPERMPKPSINVPPGTDRR